MVNAKLDVRFLVNDVIKFNTKNVLWQAYTKDDLDQENELTVNEWIEFCERYNESFAEAISEIAHNCIRSFKDHKRDGME